MPDRLTDARGWLAVRFYRLAGWAFGMAKRIEVPGPACPECELGELVGGECEVCAHNDAVQRIADEAYQQGGEDAYRDARSEFR